MLYLARNLEEIAELGPDSSFYSAKIVRISSGGNGRVSTAYAIIPLVYSFLIMVTHMETDALIRTKLIPPTLSPDVLPRPQLIERLENGRYRKLTLISAPAGYGKSILATLWANACSCPVAWLSLDKNDNDVSVFLGYFVAAMQTLFPNCCGKIEGLLNVEQTVPLDFLTAALINDTVNLSEPIVIALDDYHLIENSDIQQLVSALIQHQSEQIHLLLVTRQDPLLSLPSLRAKNQLTEIRSDDLRFGEDETRQFLENVLGERVDVELVTKISERTENWPAGLRLGLAPPGASAQGQHPGRLGARIAVARAAAVRGGGAVAG